jgi:hypothetical protein
MVVSIILELMHCSGENVKSKAAIQLEPFLRERHTPLTFAV